MGSGKDGGTSGWTKWVVDHAEIIGGAITVLFVIAVLYNIFQ